MKDQIEKAGVLIEALPYLQQFRGHIFLIKIGGSAMDDVSLVRKLLRDIVFLEAVGINPVLVHGGGKAISAAMANAGLTARFVGGLRVTDEQSIGIVERTLSTVINPDLVEGIKACGGRAIGIPGTEIFSGDRVSGTDPVTGEKADLGFVGKVTQIRLEAVKAAIRDELVPVVSPIACEIGTGHSLNVNADLAASALGGHLKASKILYLSDVLGVMKDSKNPETLIPTLNRSEVDAMIGTGEISGGMIPKVRSALEALNGGVGKAHLIDGRIPHSLLLEIFTERGIGTEIVGP